MAAGGFGGRAGMFRPCDKWVVGSCGIARTFRRHNFIAGLKEIAQRGLGGPVRDYQRSAQAPQAKPAPNAASTTRSPRFTRPASRASVSAIGMLAAVVFP